MAVNDYDWDLDEKEAEASSDFGPSHQRLSQAADYPPFSIDNGLRNEFMKAVQEAGMKTPSEKPHAPIMEQYAEQIEEAEMYQKRYGSELFEAQKAAAKLEGLEISDDKIARLSMDYDYGD